MSIGSLPNVLDRDVRQILRWTGKPGVTVAVVTTDGSTHEAAYELAELSGETPMKPVSVMYSEARELVKQVAREEWA